MKISLIVCLVLLKFCTPSHAEFLSGAKLYQGLQKINRDVADYQTGMALGYVAGVFDGYSGVLLCPPESVTLGQVNQIVFNFMEKHPEKWNESADASVVAAVIELWPCKK